MNRCRTALKSVADYVTANSDIYVSWGLVLPTPEERLVHKSAIEAVAREISTLADGPITEAARASFMRCMDRLHALGFYPQGILVSEVAQAFQQALNP